MAEAEQAGAISNRWVPLTLPKGAHDIREAHDVEGNRRWGLFSFTPADAEALREILQPEIPPSIVVRCDMPARIEWWPLVLRDELNPEQVKAAGLKVYASRPSGLVVAVNWKQGRAYYWTG